MKNFKIVHKNDNKFLNTFGQYKDLQEARCNNPTADIWEIEEYKQFRLETKREAHATDPDQFMEKTFVFLHAEDRNETIPFVIGCKTNFDSITSKQSAINKIEEKIKNH